MAGTSPRLLTVDEVAAHLYVSRTTVYRLVDAARLPVYRIASVLRFDRRDLAQFLDRSKTRSLTS